MSTTRRKVLLLHPVAHIKDKYLSHVFMFIIRFYMFNGGLFGYPVVYVLISGSVCRRDECYLLLIRFVVLCLFILSFSLL